MNLFVKLGLAALAGATVLFGLNSIDNKKKETEDTATSSREDEDIMMTGIPEDDNDIQDEEIISPKKKSNFMRNLKKTQFIIDCVSRFVTCLCRIVDCISDMFGSRRNNYAYGNSYCGGSTTIII